RIPFFIGVLMVPVGVYIRRHLDETLGHQPNADESAKAKLKDAFRTHSKQIWSGVLLIWGGTVANYLVAFYMPTYAAHFLGIPLKEALRAGILSAAILIPVSIIAGRMSDRYGRIPVTWWSRLALIVLVVPGFLMLEHYRTLEALYLVVGVLSVLLAFQAAPGIIFITELYPRPVRATSLSVVYSVGVAIFGGTAQVLATWLIKLTGSDLAPAGYLVVATLLSSLPFFWLKETAGKPI
ncbi:MAG: MFS transporter, partial [Rhodoferax sp.]